MPAYFDHIIDIKIANSHPQINPSSPVNPTELLQSRKMGCGCLVDRGGSVGGAKVVMNAPFEGFGECKMNEYLGEFEVWVDEIKHALNLIKRVIYTIRSVS